MLNQKQIKKSQKIAKEFFEKTTFDVGLTLKSKDENTLVLAVNTQEPRILIGEKGSTLFEIQFLLGMVLRKALGEYFYLDLDINEYKLNKERHLKELAQSMADRVSLEGSSKVFFPMSPYERRIIHLALAERVDIKTESLGDEPYRRVVIKPV